MDLISVLDFEATGLGKFDRAGGKEDDYPVSVGIVVARVDDGEKVVRCIDSFQSLIRVPNPMKVEETAFLHGIFPEDLENAPRPKDVCRQIVDLYRKHGLSSAGAWNCRVDRYFFDALFRMGKTEPPALRWIEMQPERRASLEHYVSRCVTDRQVLMLDAHDALNDCLRALGVMAALKGYALDLSGVRPGAVAPEIPPNAIQQFCQKAYR